jgi:hypothetical protein
MWNKKSEMKNLILLSLLFCLGCDSHLADSPSPGFLKMSLSTIGGTINILPADTLLMNIAYAKLYRGVEQRDWISISDTNKIYNLYKFIGGTTGSIGNKEITYLPPGYYTKLRVRVLLFDTVMVLSGSKYYVQIPADSLQVIDINYDVDLREGQQIELRLVFDAQQSLKLDQGRYLLYPSFRIER